MIDWSNLYKIRIANPDKSMQKHEIVKLLLVMKLLNKYKQQKQYIKIYTEFQLEGRKCDIYFENIKTKEILIYEIQKSITTNWLEKVKEFYEDYDVLFMKTDFIVVDLKRLSNDINEIDKQLEEYVF